MKSAVGLFPCRRSPGLTDFSVSLLWPESIRMRNMLAIQTQPIPFLSYENSSDVEACRIISRHDPLQKMPVRLVRCIIGASFSVSILYAKWPKHATGQSGHISHIAVLDLMVPTLSSVRSVDRLRTNAAGCGADPRKYCNCHPYLLSEILEVSFTKKVCSATVPFFECF